MVSLRGFQYLALLAGVAFATPVERAPQTTAPTVTLDQGTFTGAYDTSGNVAKFLSIPFAQPPTGSLRFQLPQPNTAYTGAHDASAFGQSCPQLEIVLPILTGMAQNTTDFILNSIYQVITPSGEDCLTVNVFKPKTATAASKLPVVVWIFGGGFELGGPTLYDGSVIVERSIALNEPVIYVSMNYRLNGFGFMPGAEIQKAGVGNLGLQDQRQALRWVQKYISTFGGDPTKVTIWGESAGAISVALQMVTNGGNAQGLFRGAFMESGSPLPVGSITDGQQYYDAVVASTGCSSASDTLACLRTVPYQNLMDAINALPGLFSYQALDLAWLPRVDGVFLTADPQVLVQQGSVAKIPFVTGDCDDEGTLFSLSTLNITTDAQFSTWVSEFFLPKASPANITQLLNLYPNDVTQGSPFGTGYYNALTPQFKRIAAFQGDAVFQAPRRFFLQQMSPKVNTWSFLSQRLKSLPIVGSAHTTDLLNIYADGELTDYLIYFTNNLDPNGITQLEWPKYSTSYPYLATFIDGDIPQILTLDTYRSAAISFMTVLTLEYPI